jgi:subtilisin family serine protease
MPSKNSLAWILIGMAYAVGAQSLSAQTPVRYREDRILIIPKRGREDAVTRLHAREKASLRRAYPRLGNIQVIQLPKGVSAPAMVERYRRSGHVRCAELDGYLQPAVVPNEPIFGFGTLWGLDNHGQMGGVEDADIDAPEAWDIRTSADNMIVAIVDSGVRYTHQDLAPNIWTNPGEVADNGVDDDGNGYIDDVHGIDALASGSAMMPNREAGDPMDDTGHGTHIAGIIGAVANNGVGVVGVAWQVQIMVCKFFGGGNAGSFSDAVQCLDYARENGAKIVNLSVEGADYSHIFYSAIESCGQAGMIVVAASGNSGINNDIAPRYPASFSSSNIVAVMATGSRDQLPSFSNYGVTSVDLGAPGSLIYSTSRASDASYGSDSGTSYAAPFVCGALALIWAQYPLDPYWRIIDRLYAAVDPVPALTSRCATGGRLNLRNALAPRPVLRGAFGGLAGDFQISLRGGEPVQTYILESSADFIAWESIATNTTTHLGRTQFSDVAAPVVSRFYRVQAAQP